MADNGETVRNAVSDRAALIAEARAWSDQTSRSPSDRKGDALIRSLVKALEADSRDLQALREREAEAGHCGGEDRCTADPACAFHCGELYGRVDEMQRKLEITDERIEDATRAYFASHEPYDWDWWLARFTVKRCDMARANIRRALEAARANIPKP